jgi:hypothetical protein
MESTIPSKTHQVTPSILSQQHASSIHKGGNKKPFQNFDEVILT